MNPYPDVVAKIASDYLGRVRSALHRMPAPERDEFLREIESHLYESYQQTQGPNDVDRILTVLRNMGEPSELVADRLPAAFLHSGTKRIQPLYILAGILIALFGVPLGAGGVAVLAGILGALVAVLVAYYTAVGAILLCGVFLLLLGLIKINAPGLWDRLVTAGVLQMDGLLADFLEQLTNSEQGFVLIAFAGILCTAGVAGIWGGRYLWRGLRFLFGLAFDRLRLGAQWIRRRFHPRPWERPAVRPFAPAP
ncbi:MAG: hypothetical protein MUC42_00305 [Bryobacter sp.]|nr:hypothetical protein [Bryobacter sp.]